MNEKTKALKAAFPYTIPVLTGYIFLGAAYGILMASKGYGLFWTFLISTCTFAGSMQFVMINLLTSAFQPFYALLLALMVNARHLFYGVSMLSKYRGTGKKKPYLIFGLTDETFSILCSTEAPQGIDPTWFMFFITLLDQCYWVGGSVLGSLLGAMVSFNTTGIDFVMTALFVVIFINQWKAQSNHTPAVIGVIVSAVCLCIFGAQQFIVPAMGLILLAISVGKRPIEQEEE